MKRKKSKSRIKVSFAATILVLVAITLVSYSFSFRIPSYSVPANLPPYRGMIGRYAPADSIQVSFENMSAVRSINSSAVPYRQLVNLIKPSVTVHLSAVQAELVVSILNLNQHINNSGTAAILSPGAYSNLSKALTESGLVPDQEQNFAIYHVNDSSNGRTKAEWLTVNPAGSSVVYAEGGTDARTVLLRMLSVWNGNSPSILSVQNVTRMLYPVGGTVHLALTIENFTGEVLTSKMGVLAVDVVDQKVQIAHVVKFVSPSYASSQVSQVQAVYKFASDFSQYEECVEAIESLAFKNLQGAVGLAGA